MSLSMLIIDTLLPEPDSPTTPSTSPGWSENDRPSTAVTVPRRVRNVTRRSWTSSKGSGTAHPRVEFGVQDVHDGVRQDHEEGRVQDRAHDHRQVDVLQRRVGQPPDARKPE